VNAKSTNSGSAVGLGVDVTGCFVPVGKGECGSAGVTVGEGVVVGGGARVTVGEGGSVAVGAAVGLGKGLTVDDGTVLGSQPATKTDVRKMPNATAECLICCSSLPEGCQNGERWMVL